MRGGAGPGRRRRPSDRSAVLHRHPRSLVAASAALAALAAGLAGGPVAAGLGAVYTAGGVAMAVRQWRAARRAAAATATLDTVGELSAELRAGAAPAAALAAAEVVLSATPAQLGTVAAAWQVSERTGAPLADVLDRVEAELRQGQRLGLAVASHRAGTRATALLLAVFPAVGVGLGYGMGADPLAFLLHTPLGGLCAGSACALQGAGLWWSERLAR